MKYTHFRNVVQKGFTLIELLVSVTLFSVIGFTGIIGIQSFMRSTFLDEVNIFRALLYEARSKSFAGTSVGLHIASNSYIVFSGPSWSAASTTTFYPRSKNITIPDSPDIVFTRGETSLEHHLEFSSQNQSISIDIHTNGSIL